VLAQTNPTSVSLKNINILLVDDEPDILALFKKTLELEGYSTYGFLNPTAAFEHFKQNPRAYQMVVTDIRMPAMNGFQLSRKIRSISPDVKIVLMTGFEMSLDELKTVLPSLQVNGLIEKPITLEKFRNTVRIAAK